MSEQADNGRMKKLLLPAVLALFIFVLCLPLLDNSFRFSGGDNAVYLLLGRGLLEGKGYTQYWGAPMVAHSKYPPFFPALIAITLLAAGEKLIVVKALLAVLLVITGIFT